MEIVEGGLCEVGKSEGGGEDTEPVAESTSVSVSQSKPRLTTCGWIIHIKQSRQGVQDELQTTR